MMKHLNVCSWSNYVYKVWFVVSETNDSSRSLSFHYCFFIISSWSQLTWHLLYLIWRDFLFFLIISCILPDTVIVIAWILLIFKCFYILYMMKAFCLFFSIFRACVFCVVCYDYSAPPGWQTLAVLQNGVKACELIDRGFAERRQASIYAVPLILFYVRAALYVPIASQDVIYCLLVISFWTCNFKLVTYPRLKSVNKRKRREESTLFTNCQSSLRKTYTI